ncbi:MAG: endonuclease/exonuclease/phosphatase family protein [Kiloniellales bacterium]
MILDWLASALTVLAVVWTALPLLRGDAWWIRMFEFPRIQVAVLTALVLAACVALAGLSEPADIVRAAVLLACIALQLAWIVQYLPLYPNQMKAARAGDPEDEIAILVANVLTPNRNAEGLLEIVRANDPDLLLTLESDAWWQERLDALDADYPHSVKCPLDNTYGMHLYSRLALVDARLDYLVEEGVPSIHGWVVLRSGHRLRLHCVHPSPPSPTENPSAAERDGELLAVAKTVAGPDGRRGERSAIVAGDLNDVAWSASTRLFQKVSGLLDPRIGRGTYATFHAKYPFLRWPLDQIFASGDFTLMTLRRLPYFGSDHFPILVRFRHDPNARDLHEEPEADAADEELAEEKIEKVDAEEPPRAGSG